MTLEKTWEKCLKMWKWIAEEGIYICGDVTAAKKTWLSFNGYHDIYNYCFFCDYAEKHNGSSDCGNCVNCPAQKIDADFCCQDAGIHWSKNPEEFYRRLVRLNKRRLSKKGKK